MEGSPDRFLGMVMHGQTLERVLGRGPLTTVYRARATGGGPPMLVTLLALPDTLSARAHWHVRERFWQLAERIEGLRHPNLLPLYGYGERHGQCYLLTPELVGTPLLASLSHGRIWSPQETLALLAPLASALECLRQHGLSAPFFHPATLLLLAGHDELASGLQMTHVGLMSLLRRLELPEEETAGPAAPSPHLQSVSGHYLGSPDYLAPEVVQGQSADARSDVYTLGILLFTLLSGRPPFTGAHYLEIARQHLSAPLPSLHALVPTLPIVLEGVINQALQRDPDRRFPHPHALLDACTSVLAEHRSWPVLPVAFPPMARPTTSRPTPPVALPPEPTSEPLPVVFPPITRPVASRPTLPPEPTSEPLLAITPASLWQRQAEQIRATAQATTAPLLPAITTPTSPPRPAPSPDPPTETARHQAINQLILDMQQRRQRLQELAHGFGREMTEERPAALERSPDWLT